MRALRFELSAPPPSANNSTTVVHGRKIKSAAFRAWFDRSVMELTLQGRRLPDACYWRIDILVPASKTRADLDNVNKACIDALVKAGRVPDDRFLVDMRSRFWAGAVVVLAVQQENLSKWSRIRNPSKSLYRKLALSSR